MKNNTFNYFILRDFIFTPNNDSKFEKFIYYSSGIDGKLYLCQFL